MRHISEKEREEGWGKSLATALDIEITDWQAEFIERANRGVISLQHTRNGFPSGSHEYTRLGGKIEGLKLGLSWVDEARRSA